jgi:uncharacterized protein (DUF58 family)
MPANLLSRLLKAPPRRRRTGREIAAEELVRRVERIAIAARRAADSSSAGEYRAVFHGRGMEFSEVREYMPGDDVRAIDWNVTARAGAPFVKLYREERDRTLLLLLDVSASQDFGSRLATKRDLTAEAAAALALSAVRNRDRVGAVLFTDRIESVRRPRRGRENALAIVREALSRPLEGFGTDLALGLRAAEGMLKTRSIVVLVSDFRAAGWEAPLARLARRHEVVAVAVADPAEKDLARAGLVRLRDAETGAVSLADTASAAFRRAWSSAARTSASEICAREGVDFLELSSARAPARDLAAFFRSRSGRR